MAQPTEKAALREQRLAEGLCPECGTRLYEVVKRNRRSTIKTLFNKKDKDQTDDGVKMVPLTLPGVVERGQCMKCCLSSPVGGMDDDTPAVKAVPVTVKSPGAAYAHTGEDSETEDLLGMMESDNKSNDSSFRGSFSDFGRSDTGNSIYSTDTEYDDVPAMDMANMDLNDPVSSRGGVRYAHSDSAGLDDDLLAPIPDHNLNSHFAAIPPAAAAAQDPDQQKMPSKPEPLDCPDGMNPDVFYQLPPEVQKEVSQQRSDIDPDVLASLPVHLRQEVLDQARNKSGRKGSVSFAQNDEQERVKKNKTALDRKSLSKSTKEFLLGYDIGEDEFDELDEDVQVDLLAQKPKTNTRAEMMKSSLSKSTIGFLAGFDINEADFESLDEDVKKDLLAEKNKSSSNRSSISGPCVASEVGLDSQYDPELLASLPEDLRNELLEEERQKRGRDDSQRSRNSRNSVGAHSVNIPAGYDPDTFEALPLEMQQELMEAANGGIVYSADGYGNDSIARAPVVSAHAAGQEKATYEGEYNDAGKRHGEGTLTWRNGDVYVGWFKNGFMEGRGTITFHDGKTSVKLFICCNCQYLIMYISFRH